MPSRGRVVPPKAVSPARWPRCRPSWWAVLEPRLRELRQRSLRQQIEEAREGLRALARLVDGSGGVRAGQYAAGAREAEDPGLGREASIRGGPDRSEVAGHVGEAERRLEPYRFTGIGSTAGPHHDSDGRVEAEARRACQQPVAEGRGDRGGGLPIAEQACASGRSASTSPEGLGGRCGPPAHDSTWAPPGARSAPRPRNVRSSTLRSG